MTPALWSTAGVARFGSDNEAWEISAIDTAVSFLGNRLWAYNLVNVTTSAFQQLYVGYLERFTTAVLDAIEGRPVCLGHIDCYNEPIRVLEYVSQHWVRTSCFFLRRMGNIRGDRLRPGCKKRSRFSISDAITREMREWRDQSRPDTNPGQYRRYDAVERSSRERRVAAGSLPRASTLPLSPHDVQSPCTTPAVNNWRSTFNCRSPARVRPRPAQFRVHTHAATGCARIPEGNQPRASSRWAFRHLVFPAER